jgi:hypothetical protein
MCINKVVEIEQYDLLLRYGVYDLSANIFCDKKNMLFGPLYTRTK